MIRINLIREILAPGTDFTEYLLPRVIGRKGQFLGAKVSSDPLPDSRTEQNFASEGRLSGIEPLAPMTPELRECLLGKAPLRLITERTNLHKNCWKEKLECGHEVTVFADFYWDEGSHLVNLKPSAKRRRCTTCKELAAAIAPKKPSQSVTRVQKERAE